jgi:APA family basic amino acid/polyamine antiporter
VTSPSAGDRGVSLFDAVLLVCGAVVGIGIFFTPTQIAEQVSSPGMFLGVWIAAGVLTLLGCFTISELGAAFPREGGIYIYLLELVGPLWAFLYGWSAVWIASTGGLAVVATFMGDNIDKEHSAQIGAAVLLGFGAVCALGLRVGARFQSLLMLSKLAGIFALLYGGWSLAGAPSDPEPLLGTTSASSGGGGSFALALLPALFAYMGWANLGNITNRLREPVRDLPRAIILGMGGVILLYVSLAAVYLHAVGLEGIRENQLVASELARLAFGSTGEDVFRVGLAVSAGGVCLCSLILLPWVTVAMAKNGHFFRMFAFVHPKTGAPLASLVTLVIISICWMLFVDSDLVLEAQGQNAIIVNTILLGGYLSAIRRQPGLKRPYKSPFHPWIPRLYFVLLVSMLAGQVHGLFQERSLSDALTLLGISFGTLLSGAIVYGPWRWLVARADREVKA